MLFRFASAVSVASPAVAVATTIALLLPDVPPQLRCRLTSLWCIVPAGWGLWAMLAPPAWVPRRLPLWGAMLGLLIGMVVVFDLNLPAEFLDSPPPTALRGLVVSILVGLYYLLWILVRMALEALTRDSQRSERAAGSHVTRRR